MTDLSTDASEYILPSEDVVRGMNQTERENIVSTLTSLKLRNQSELSTLSSDLSGTLSSITALEELKPTFDAELLSTTAATIESESQFKFYNQQYLTAVTDLSNSIVAVSTANGLLAESTASLQKAESEIKEADIIIQEEAVIEAGMAMRKEEFRIAYITAANYYSTTVLASIEADDTLNKKIKEEEPLLKAAVEAKKEYDDAEANRIKTISTLMGTTDEVNRFTEEYITYETNLAISTSVYEYAQKEYEASAQALLIYEYRQAQKTQADAMNMAKTASDEAAAVASTDPTKQPAAALAAALYNTKKAYYDSTTTALAPYSTEAQAAEEAAYQAALAAATSSIIAYDVAARSFGEQKVAKRAEREALTAISTSASAEYAPLAKKASVAAEAVRISSLLYAEYISTADSFQAIRQMASSEFYTVKQQRFEAVSDISGLAITESTAKSLYSTFFLSTLASEKEAKAADTALTSTLNSASTLNSIFISTSARAESLKAIARTKRATADSYMRDASGYQYTFLRESTLATKADFFIQEADLRTLRSLADSTSQGALGQLRATPTNSTLQRVVFSTLAGQSTTMSTLNFRINLYVSLGIKLQTVADLLDVEYAKYKDYIVTEDVFTKSQNEAMAFAPGSPEFNTITLSTTTRMNEISKDFKEREIERMAAQTDVLQAAALVRSIR
jgi:hypothetical protein